MIIRFLLRLHYKIVYFFLSVFGVLGGSLRQAVRVASRREASTLKKISRSPRQKRKIQFILLFTFMLAMTGCNFFGINSSKEQLPAVSSLTPPKLPDWIEQLVLLAMQNLSTKFASVLKKL